MPGTRAAVEPASWYAQFLYGFHFYQQNEMPQAIAALEKARRLNPRDPRTALYLGLAEETLGHTGAALKLYRESIRLEPQTPALLAGARLLLTLGQLDECERLIARALQVEPASRDAHFNPGRLLLKKGKPAEAAREGETALRLRSGE